MRKLTILTVFVLSSLFGFSQSEEYETLRFDTKYREGYIQLPDSSKEEGLIWMTNNPDDAATFVIDFVAKTGEQKTFLPTQLLGYSHSGVKYVSTGELFLELFKEGQKANLYRVYNIGYNESFGGETHNFPDVYYLKKPGEKSFTYVNPSKFKKEIGAYFEDCETIKERIKSLEWSYLDIKKIVWYYNTRCDGQAAN